MECFHRMKEKRKNEAANLISLYAGRFYFLSKKIIEEEVEAASASFFPRDVEVCSRAEMVLGAATA